MDFEKQKLFAGIQSKLLITNIEPSKCQTCALRSIKVVFQSRIMECFFMRQTVAFTHNSYNC